MKGAAVVVTLLGFAVCLTWAISVGQMQHLSPGRVTMKPMTAFAFMVAGAGFWMPRYAHWAGMALTSVTAFVFLGWFGVVTTDPFQLDATNPVDTVAPGSPAVSTFTCFAFLAATLLTRLKHAACWASMSCCGITGFLAAMGYATDEPTLYSSTEWSTGMAVHTAAGMILLAAAHPSDTLRPPSSKPDPDRDPDPNPGDSLDMTPKLKLGIATAVLISLASCTAPTSAYVVADRATFKAISPEYLAYVKADPTLSPAQVKRRIATVSSWDTRIKVAEGGAR